MGFFIMSDHMTKKHRWMTLRDDVVFFIFLYQRYLYPIDHTRPDEYGLVYGEEAQTLMETAQPENKLEGKKEDVDNEKKTKDASEDSAEAKAKEEETEDKMEDTTSQQEGAETA